MQDARQRILGKRVSRDHQNGYTILNMIKYLLNTYKYNKKVTISLFSYNFFVTFALSLRQKSSFN